MQIFFSSTTFLLRSGRYGLLLGCLFLLHLSVLNSQATNAIDRYFQQYLDDDRFSVVYISPKVFQLIDRIQLGDIETNEQEARLLKEVAKDLRGLRILSTSTNPAAFYAEAKRKIDTQTYELLMTVRQGNSSDLQFFIYEDVEGVIREFLLLSGGPTSFTLVSFVGRINLETITRLADEMKTKN